MWVSLPAEPKFWVSGPVAEVLGHGTAVSKRAQGKDPASQVGYDALVLTEEELVHGLQVEEVVVEAFQGRDIATLEVVIAACGQLMHSQLEELGVPTI